MVTKLILGLGVCGWRNALMPLNKKKDINSPFQKLDDHYTSCRAYRNIMLLQKKFHKVFLFFLTASKIGRSQFLPKETATTSNKQFFEGNNHEYWRLIIQGLEKEKHFNSAFKLFMRNQQKLPNFTPSTARMLVQGMYKHRVKTNRTLFEIVTLLSFWQFKSWYFIYEHLIHSIVHPEFTLLLNLTYFCHNLPYFYTLPASDHQELIQGQSKEKRFNSAFKMFMKNQQKLETLPLSSASTSANQKLVNIKVPLVNILKLERLSKLFSRAMKNNQEPKNHENCPCLMSMFEWINFSLNLLDKYLS